MRQQQKKTTTRYPQREKKIIVRTPYLVCEISFHHIAEGRAVASADSTVAASAPFPALSMGVPPRFGKSHAAGRTQGPLALMPGSSVSHSMVVRLKFPGSPRKAAAIEPFSSALLGALNEMTRRREIVWRHVERTERRHDANIDLVREPLEIVDESPRDQQGDCVQGPCDRPFRLVFQVAGISSWKHDDP